MGRTFESDTDVRNKMGFKLPTDSVKSRKNN